jgi:sugar lactone lactonase YvrE
MLSSKFLLRLKIGVCILFILQLVLPNVTNMNTRKTGIKSFDYFLTSFTASLQSGGLRIKELNPVVNENNQITLTAVDSNGQPVTGVTWESGSTDVASVDSQAGNVRGVQRGFATVTARKGNETFSVFVAVTRVNSSKGVKVPGDQEADTSGAVYFSDPVNHVIFKKDSPSADVKLFAGQMGARGNRTNVSRSDAQFAGPTAVTVDNRAQGGIYIADTLNHSIRKISFSDQTTTEVGTGSPGVNSQDVTPFAQAAFNGPQGVATDLGGNLFVSDTNNNAIYMLDFQKKEVRLVAGEPGQSGNTDGNGRAARFNRPTAITVRSRGSSFFTKGDPDGIFVADAGNNRIRFITRDGRVSTLGKIPNSQNFADSITEDQTDGSFEFPEVKSISTDGIGNIYIVDNTGAKIISLVGGTRQVTSLAQPGVGFKADNVLVRGNETFVLDGNASSNEDAVKIVTVGAPEISSLSKDEDRLEGGAEVIVTGKNFAPESLVVLGDRVVTDAVVETATRIRLRVPPQDAPGKRTLSVLTRGGVIQREFKITSKSFDLLETGDITTIAGGVPFLKDGGRAATAMLNGPQSVAIDGAGNLYIADTANSRIRRLDINSGVITTVVGNGVSSFSGDGGPAISASLNTPRGVVVDGAGNLIISDVNAHRVRLVDINTGIIRTIAGNGIPSFSGDGEPAINAGLFFPLGMAIDKKGNLFIAEPGNDRIRRVDAITGIISTFAGNGNSDGPLGDGGLAINASLNFPTHLAIDDAGNLFIADSGRSRIRKVDTKGIITTIAGNGNFSFSGDGGLAINASLDLFVAGGIAVDGKGNVLVSDTGNNRIRKIDTSGIITTVIGNGVKGFGGDGGPANGASLNLGLFSSIAVDGVGNILIADSGNNRIRRIDLGNLIGTVAGSPSSNGDGGPATAASLNNPFKVLFDKSGNLIIADSSGRIRKMDLRTGIITTIAGTGETGFSGDGSPAVNARIGVPTDIVIDSSGNIFIADRFNARIRKVDSSTGIITTYAGNGCDPFTQNCQLGDGGPAVKATLSNPEGLAIDKEGNLFIADQLFNTVRRVDAKTGIIRTVVGVTAEGGFGGDKGPAINARLRLPEGMVVDAEGNLFIADAGNNRVRKVDGRTGIITTVAGNGTPIFNGDGGLATAASLNNPISVSIDNTGNLLISDSNNHAIRRVNKSTGIITTIAGNGTAGYSGDGGPSIRATLSNPKGMAVNDVGDIFVAAGFNDSVRAIRAVGVTQPLSDFTLEANPVVRNVAAGASADFVIGVRPVNGFSQPVNLNVAFTSPDANGKLIASLSASTVTPGTNANLTISVTPETMPASFNLAITGTSGQIVRTQSITVNVVTQPSVTITGARFVKPNLTISGSGFGTAGARVSVNGQDISSIITSQNDGSIILKGNKKKLAIKKGTNQVTVTAGWATSNTFVFNFLNSDN